jgi:autotransporter-associated beta strand protein
MEDYGANSSFRENPSMTTEQPPTFRQARPRLRGILVAAAGFILAAAPLAGGASFLEVARIDLAPTSNPNNASFIGSFPSSVAWNGSQLFVGGFNASGKTQDIGIVEVLDPLGMPTFGDSFARINVPDLHAYNGLAASTTGLAAAYDDYAGTHQQRLQVFELDTTRRWEIGGRSSGFRPMGGVAFDPGFAGAGGGVSSLQFNSGRRQLWDATTGDNIYGSTNGMVIFGPGGSGWRGHDYSASGDLWLRNQNRVDASTRTGANSVTDNRRVVDLPAAAFVSGQNVAFMEGTPFGDLLIFNSRTETVGGQAFANQVMVTTAGGTMVNPEYTWLDGAPADGNGYYDFAYHAPSQTLALLDFNSRNLHLLSLTAPGPGEIVIDVPFGTTQTQAEAGYPTLSGTTPVVKTGDGTLVLAAVNALAGMLYVRGGYLSAENPEALGTATLDVSAGATFTIAPAIGAANPLRVSQLGEIAGTIDVSTGRFSLPASGDSPSAELRSLLVSGRSGGGWNGAAGIVSTAAEASGGTRAVGYVVSPDGSAMVAFAAPGDTNLNGQVDVFDLVGVNSSGRYGTGQAAVWSQGDFNYDGVTNVFDLVGINTAGAYGQGNYLPASPSAAGGVAAVPEPTSWLLTFTGLASGYYILRRRVA